MAGEENPCHTATHYILHHTRADLAINQGLHFRKLATNRHCLHCLQNAKLRSNAVLNPHVFRLACQYVRIHRPLQEIWGLYGVNNSGVLFCWYRVSDR